MQEVRKLASRNLGIAVRDEEQLRLRRSGERSERRRREVVVEIGRIGEAALRQEEGYPREEATEVLARAGVTREADRRSTELDPVRHRLLRMRRRMRLEMEETIGRRPGSASRQLDDLQRKGRIDHEITERAGQAMQERFRARWAEKDERLLPRGPASMTECPEEGREVSDMIGMEVGEGDVAHLRPA